MRIAHPDESSDDDDGDGDDDRSSSQSKLKCTDYSIPVRIDSKQTSTKSVSAVNPIPLSEKNSKHLSENGSDSFGEIAGEMNHHYHILDNVSLLLLLCCCGCLKVLCMGLTEDDVPSLRYLYIKLHDLRKSAFVILALKFL